MQRPNLPALAQAIRAKDPRIDLSDVVYFIGTETVVPSKDRKTAMPRWQEAIFAALDRNAAHLATSCNCRRNRSSKSAGKFQFDQGATGLTAFGVSKDGEAAVRIMLSMWRRLAR